MSFDINEYYNKLNGGDVLLAYKGSITSDLISNVLEVVEAKLEDLSEGSKVRKKVYNVLVEIMQNLFHHVEDLPQEMHEIFEPKFGVLVVSRVDNNVYKIITGNFINSGKIKILKDKIGILLRTNSSNSFVGETKELSKDLLNLIAGLSVATMTFFPF